ncbi:MAG: carboxymuconolactone decarboxylase family protein [Pseudomonadota bacterium]
MRNDDGPYLAPLRREEVPQLEPLFEMCMELLGFVANDLLTIARKPEFAQKILEFTMTVMDESTLPDDLINLINLLASATAGCRYCTGHTANRAGEFGMDAAKVAAIWEFESSPLYSERERAALMFTLKASQTPSGLDKPDFEAASKHFSDTEIVEMLMIICQMGFWNRWNDSLATTLEPTPLAFSKATLPGTRWQAGKHDSM